MKLLAYSVIVFALFAPVWADTAVKSGGSVLNTTETADTGAVSFHLEKQADAYVLKSSETTLKNQLKGENLPYGFILPDSYCGRDDLTYVVKCSIQPDWNAGAENKRCAVFSFGLNVSGNLPDSVSLVFLDGKMLYARISASDKNAKGQVVTLEKIEKGKKYNLELRIDCNKIELFFDNRRIGAASVGNGFSWIKNRTFYIGAEMPGSSVFNGKINDFSITILPRRVDKTLTDQSGYRMLIQNPYNKYILGSAEGILLSGSEYFENRIAKENNDWLFRDMANNMMMLSYCYTLPESGYYKSPDVLKFLTRAIAFLAKASGENDWVSRKNGDPNINRFTLVPFAETMQNVGNDLPEDVRTAANGRIKAVLNRQYQEYGKKYTSLSEIYPNMDVYYLLAMLHGSMLLKDKLFSSEYDRVLHVLETAQYPDGGWPYIKTTNESTHYHEMVAGAVARVYSLTKSPVAMSMLQKSIPYYKLSVGPSGIPEYVTDPFWKHNWTDLAARGPDIVAGMTGDGNNKWIAGRAIPGGVDVLDVYAAMFWKDIKAEPMTDNYVVFDRNINGPRGVFSDLNWVCSASYGCDTLVGCYTRDTAGELKGLLAVKAEIVNPDNMLGMPPSGNKGNTVINADSAVFSSEYRMGNFRNIWGQALYPYDWTCRQQWSLDRKSITGEILITSAADQKSPPPAVRFIFGKNGEIKKISAAVFDYGPYRLSVEKSDFSEVSINNVPVSPLNKSKLDGRELLFSIPVRKDYKKGETFLIKVKIQKD